MSRHRAGLAGVLLLSVGLNVVAVWWGLPSRFAWAPDELQPQIILQGIDERFSGDWHQPAYPPFHYYVLAATYLPVLALGAVDVDGISGRTLFYYLGRVVSLAMAIGTLLTVYHLAMLLFGDRRTAVLGTAVAAFSTTFVYYAKFANLDVPAAFWVLVSLFFFVRHVAQGADRDLLWFALAAALAMGTKDQAYAFYVLPVPVYLLHRFRAGEPVLGRPVLVAGGASLLAFLAIHNVVFNVQGFIHHFEEILWARRHYSSFEGTLSQQADLLVQSLLHVKFSLGWPGAVAGALGIALAWRDRRERPLAMWVLLAGVSYYAFFIAPVRSTWLRYIVPLSLIVSMFSGRALSWLVARGNRWYRAGVGAALAYSFLHAASVDVLLMNDSRYTVERWLHEHVTDDEIVAFMGPEYYLPRLDGLPARRLRPTESVLARSQPDYVVVNPEFAARFEPGTREGELFAKLAAGRSGYGLALGYQWEPPPWMLLDFEGVLGNMAKINPRIDVYERAE